MKALWNDPRALLAAICLMLILGWGYLGRSVHVSVGILSEDPANSQVIYCTTACAIWDPHYTASSDAILQPGDYACTLTTHHFGWLFGGPKLSDCRSTD